MQKVHKKLLVLIIIAINFIGIMVSFGAGVSNAQTSSTASTKDRLQAIKEKGVLTVASANDKPFAYIDPQTNKFTGVDAEIITEVARRLGIDKVEMKYVPFENLLTELNKNNDIDIVADGLYVTDERKKEVLFTNVLYKEPEVIIIPGVSKFNFKEDLKDAVVGAQNKTVFLDLAREWEKEGLVKKIKILESQSELILAVANGEVDAGITDSLAASYIISKDKNLNLKIVTPYKPEILGMVAVAVKKEDATFADEINKKIDEMKEDRTLTGILKKYGLNESNFVSIKDGHILDQ